MNCLKCTNCKIDKEPKEIKTNQIQTNMVFKCKHPSAGKFPASLTVKEARANTCDGRFFESSD